MKLKFNSKYNTIAAYVLIVFSICLLLGAAVIKYDKFVVVFRAVLKTFSPIIWGLIIAYLLNPIMVKADNFLKPIINKKKERNSTVRVVSIVITSVLAIAVLTAVIAMVIPELVNSLNVLIDNAPAYFNNLYNTVMEFLDNNPELSSTIRTWLEEQVAHIQDSIISWISSLKPTIENIITVLKNGLSSVFSGVKDFILGFIVSLYLLYNKEQFLAQSKKVLYAFFSKKRCEKLLNIGKEANEKFTGFLSGKAIDSFIIAMLAFTTLTIMEMPYTVLISCIIGITNMIPFFGPIIGAVPCGILVLLYNPAKVIPFIIFVVVLQQIDGNIIGPKILGNSIGLPTFWIIFAIFIGGGLFGFIGMLIGVPVFAIIYTLFKNSVDEKLKLKNLSTDIEDYYSPEPIITPEKAEKPAKHKENIYMNIITAVKDKVIKHEEELGKHQEDDEELSEDVPEETENQDDEE